MKNLLAYALAVTLATTSVSAVAEGAFAPPPPDIAGRAYILNDFYSGQTLAARDPDTRIEPASLTKLMTAYLTFKALKEKRLTLEQQLTVSQKGWRTEGSRMFLDPRIPATVNDLIHGMIIQSGNDACVTLAEAIAGSEEVFGQLMTREARRLGMNGTNFQNSTGLPGAQHYTTVRDLGILANALIRDFPEFYPIYSKKEFRYNNITQPNRNLLLYRDPNVDGMKTGFTDAAGYNLVASSRRDGRRVVSVVVGTTSPEARAVESSKLLNYGLQFFDTPRLYMNKKPVSKLPVFKGKESELEIGVSRDVYVSVPKGTSRKIQVQMTTQKPLLAPIKAGQTVGKLSLSLDGKVLAEQPLVALKEVPEAGFFGRLIDSIKLMLQ
ncbi:D-alanyl-D-alanine carboxypeptidase family protein [Aquaspirillum serpens]|uniref:D-alanyl-D-alanine carboxypeptidase family protein n=1 Tax=Aquaspirillum serpens TaxID=190 RepID=UPI0003B58E0E|nr:D-alanyl-D-alanine carboxypeptidase family protein [Aquaspirillum serpens]